MRMLSRLAPALMIVLAGCGGLATAPPPQLLANSVTLSREQGGRFLAFVGPPRQHSEPFLGVPRTNFYLLRSWIDTRTGETAHQLYVEDSYFGAERNYDAANAGAGRPLKFVPISKNQIACDGACSYAEEFGAELPETLLRASPQGLHVVFTAKSGPELAISVPGELVAKQLAAIDAVRASRPKAAATPPPR